MNEKFDRKSHHAEKYPGEKLKYFSDKERKRKLATIKQVMLESLKWMEERCEDKWQVKSPIIGAILYGSWVEGMAHTKSDLDIIYIASGDNPFDRIGEIDTHLEAILRSRGIDTQVEIATQRDYIDLRSPTVRSRINEMFLEEDGRLSGKYVVISGDQKVIDGFENIRPKN